MFNKRIGFVENVRKTEFYIQQTQPEFGSNNNMNIHTYNQYMYI